MKHKLFLIGLLSVILSEGYVHATTLNPSPYQTTFGQCTMKEETQDCGDDPELGGSEKVYVIEESSRTSSSYRLAQCSPEQQLKAQSFIQNEYQALGSTETLSFANCDFLSRAGRAEGIMVAKLVDAERSKPSEPGALAILRLNAKGSPETPILKIFKSSYSRWDGHSVYTLERVCDTDANRTPDLIIRHHQYFGHHDLIFNLDRDLKILTPARDYDSTGCTC